MGGQKGMKKIFSIIKPAISLVVFCAVITAALAGTNLITKDRIAELAVKKQEDAMRKICEADEYRKYTVEHKDASYTYYVAKTDGQPVCYIFTATASGYGGDVSVMTGINPDGTVKSVEILDASGETPGMGQNVKKESFISQYASKSGKVNLSKTESNDTTVTAITGATISSTAVTDCVNSALEMFKTEAGGDENEQ